MFDGLFQWRCLMASEAFEFRFSSKNSASSPPLIGLALPLPSLESASSNGFNFPHTVIHLLLIRTGSVFYKMEICNNGSTKFNYLFCPNEFLCLPWSWPKTGKTCPRRVFLAANFCCHIYILEKSNLKVGWKALRYLSPEKPPYFLTIREKRSFCTKLDDGHCNKWNEAIHIHYFLG